MRKIQKRLKQRYYQFARHPLTKGKECLALWRYISFHLMIRFNGKIVYEWIEPLKFIARKGEAGIVGNIYYGLFEFEESIFLLHLLNKNDLFLDIGANVGHYSLLMAGLKQTKCIAIEPVPKTYDRLNENVGINHLDKLIESRNIGVSNTSDLLYFSTDRGTMDRIVDGSYINSAVVQVETIDSILEDKVPLALKIDVEGYEKYALHGATKILSDSNLKVLILELNNSGRIYEVNDHEIFNLVLCFGFRPYSYDPKNRVLKELISFNTHQFNTIFLRDLEFVNSRIIVSPLIKVNNQFFDGMKIYYSPKHYNPAYRRQVFPLLKAFIKNEGFTDAERQVTYGVSEVDFEIVEDMDAAQVIILTMSWDYYSKTKQMSLAYNLIDEAKQRGKQVWSINNGDFGVKLPHFNNLIVFRQSGYTTNNQLGHTGFPSIINDYVSQNALEAMFFNSKYDKRPIVGFCGQASTSKRNAIKEIMKQVLRNLRTQMGFSNLEPQKVLSTSYLRGTLLKHIERNAFIDCRFIKRKQYRAGVTKNKETHETTIKFYENMLESQYVLCVRGAGNFSVRFYETLMMGRIPLYVHTDGYLPLPDDIDWKSHVVWVDYKDRHRISEILLDFHHQLDQEGLTALFKKNRKLWQEKLTLSGFFDTKKCNNDTLEMKVKFKKD